MARKPREAAEAVFGSHDYLKEVLNLIPDEKKDTVLSVLGERIMAKDDYSREKDDLVKKEAAVASYKETLDGWYGEKAQLLEEAERLKAEKKQAAPVEGSAALKDLENYIKKDDLEKIVADRLRNSEETALNLFPRVMDLSVKHLHEYGKPLNPSEVIAHARKSNMTLENAYLDMTKEARDLKTAEAEKAKLEKIRAEIRAEVVKEQGHGVFPVAPDSGIEGALSGLASKDGGDKSSRISSAVEDFYKNGMNRRSAS